MILEIIGKLNHFLDSHLPIKEECDAVYLMVELRKLVDHKEAEIHDRLFPIIRFYADWTVHTRKDRNTIHIQAMIDKLEENLNPYPKDGDLSFISMSHLREEMLDLFNKFDLQLAIFEKENWLTFANILSHVLADQPIVFQKAKDISEFCYVDAGNGRLMATINFSDGRGSITLGGAVDVF